MPALEKLVLCSFARLNRDSPERATGSPRCDRPARRAKTAERESKKRPAPEATTEDKKAAAATQLLAANAAVSDADLDALLPDEGYVTLAKPAAPEKKNAAVTDADLDSILPDYEKKDAQPEG